MVIGTRATKCAKLRRRTKQAGESVTFANEPGMRKSLVISVHILWFIGSGIMRANARRLSNCCGIEFLHAAPTELGWMLAVVVPDSSCR